MMKPAKVKIWPDNSEHEHSDENDERKPSDQIRVPCDKVQIEIMNMKRDKKQLIKQPERNNNFRRVILDT